MEITHELKVHPKWFKDLLLGLKKIEIRKDDRGYQEGDIVILNEFDPVEERYTGSQIKRKITYIQKDCDGLEEGYVILQLYDYLKNR